MQYKGVELTMNVTGITDPNSINITVSGTGLVTKTIKHNSKVIVPYNTNISIVSSDVDGFKTPAISTKSYTTNTTILLEYVEVSVGVYIMDPYEVLYTPEQWRSRAGTGSFAFICFVYPDGTMFAFKPNYIGLHYICPGAGSSGVTEFDFQAQWESTTCGKEHSDYIKSICQNISFDYRDDDGWGANYGSTDGGQNYTRCAEETVTSYKGSPACDYAYLTKYTSPYGGDLYGHYGYVPCINELLQIFSPESIAACELVGYPLSNIMKIAIDTGDGELWHWQITILSSDASYKNGHSYKCLGSSAGDINNLKVGGMSNRPGYVIPCYNDFDNITYA